MNCKKCNKEIPSDSKFCPFCGEDNSEELKKENINKHSKKIIANSLSLKTMLVILIIGVWVLVFQNLGIIPVTQNVRVKQIDYGQEIRISGPVDANLQYINGQRNVFYNSWNDQDNYYRIPVITNP